MPAPHVTSIRPPYAIEGGRVSVEGDHFPVDQPRLPDVHLGAAAARVVYATSSRLDLIVPGGVKGSAAVRVAGAGDDDSSTIQIAGPFATGLHQVDNPAFDDAGNLYVTYSGKRGEQVPVSIFRLRPNGAREPFSSSVVNPTSVAVDPDGRVYVSSRFEGTVYRLTADGTTETFATDLGVACGLTFGPDGTLFVGDRSGTIFKVDRNGRATPFASLPASVAAFHLALGPDGSLFVSGPTLASYDVVHRVSPAGDVGVYSSAFGRPQGLAFDSTGTLFVVEALAGASGVYRLPEGERAELVLAGPGLIGLAFAPDGSLVVCSNDVAYRLP